MGIIDLQNLRIFEGSRKGFSKRSNFSMKKGKRYSSEVNSAEIRGLTNLETELVREERIRETKRYIHISQFVGVCEKDKTHAERSKHRSQLGGGKHTE